MKEIPLTQGKIALVDEEDYPRLSAFKWSADRRNNRWYAIRATNDPKTGTKTTIRMHTLLIYAPNGMEIDHKNGDGLDNRKENLRLATRRQNIRNAQPRQNASSRYKGVSWHKASRKWMGQIVLPMARKGTPKYLGLFENEEDAARAYDTAAKEHFGEFARTNFL